MGGGISQPFIKVDDEGEESLLLPVTENALATALLRIMIVVANEGHTAVNTLTETD